MIRSVDIDPDTKEFCQISVPEADAGLYVADGWEYVERFGDRACARKRLRTPATCAN